MFSSFVSLSVPKFGFGRTAETATPVKIPSVQVHDSETAADKRGRNLKHLLKLNHVNFAILYHHLQFHNHTPHVGSHHICSLSVSVMAYPTMIDGLPAPRLRLSFEFL